MPVFMIERTYAVELDPTLEDLEEVKAINDAESVRWLYSFLSVDRRKTYCLYEAVSAEAIRSAARRAGLPADVVVEVQGRILPDGSLQPA